MLAGKNDLYKIEELSKLVDDLLECLDLGKVQLILTKLQALQEVQFKESNQVLSN